MKKNVSEVSRNKNTTNSPVTKIRTTYPILRIPFVPNAVRNMPFTIHPVKK